MIGDRFISLVATAVVVLIGVPVIILVLTRVWPNPKFKIPLEHEVAEETPTLLQIAIRVLACLILLLIVSTCTIRIILELLRRIVSENAGDTKFLVTPSSSYWWIVAMAWGFVVTGVLGDRVMRRVFKQGWVARALQDRSSTPYDLVAVARFFRPPLVIALIAGPAIGLWTCTAFYDDRIVIHGPFDLAAHSYRYDEIRTVFKVAKVRTSFGTKDTPHYAIEFRDGRIWTTRALRTPAPKNDDAMMDWVAKRAEITLFPIVSMGG